MIRLLVAATAVAAIALAARLPAPPADAPSLHEQGRAVYTFRCYFCHGYSGDARTLAADRKIGS